MHTACNSAKQQHFGLVFFLFISSMLLIPVTIENMQFAVWTQLPCCIFQSESVLNGVVSLWVKKCQFQIWVLDFFFPWPVFSQTHAVTGVQSLLTSSTKSILCRVWTPKAVLLKTLKWLLPPSCLNRHPERAGTALSVIREILHFNPKLTETIPLQFKFYFFLMRHCS